MKIYAFLRRHLAVLLVTVVAVLGLSSCSPYALVNSTTYNNANLRAYKTFRIVTPDTENRLPPGMQMVTYYNIAAAIRQEMVDRGYTEDPMSPLLINIGLTVKREIETAPAYPYGFGGPYPWYGPWYRGMSPWFMYPRGYYWPNYYSNAQVITGIYDEGVLTMDMINMPQHLPLYSASVAAILDGSGRFRNLSGIAQAVQTLFSKFPVPMLPQYSGKK